MVESNGCEPPTSDIAVLQEECAGQVDSMVGPQVDDVTITIVTEPAQVDVAVVKRGLRK